MVTVARKSLPLSARDIEDLEKLRSTPGRLHVLADLSDCQLGPSPTEARFLHAIYRAGLRAVEERALEDGYAEIANQARDTRMRQAVSRRRRPNWADE